MKKIKWIFILLVLAVIGSFLPEDESEGVSSSVNSEDTNDLEDDNPEESIDGEKEDIIYSPDRYANEIIIQFNDQNPDTPVTLDMVETWTTGGGEATLVTYEDYCMQFGHVDGYATFLIFSDKEKNEDNKEAFLDESVKWTKAIFTGTYYDVNQIIKKAFESESIVKTELEYHYQKYHIRYEEDEEDYYQKYHTFMINISPTLW